MSELRGVGEDAVTHHSLEGSIEKEGGLHQDIVIEEGADPNNHRGTAEQAERELQANSQNALR